MRDVEDGNARVRTEYGGNGKGRRGAVLLLALGVLFAGAVPWQLRAPLDPFHVEWVASLAVGAGLGLALGSLQLRVWLRPFQLTVGREGFTLHRSGRTCVVSWEAISGVAIEPASVTFRAVCLKVWPAAAVTLPRWAGARCGGGAVALCQLNTIDGTAEELAASIRHFAPPTLTAPER